MEPLFRLVLVRPAIAQDPAKPSIVLAQDSSFQQALVEASKAEKAYPALLQTARDFITKDDFIGSPDANPLGEQLTALALALDQLERAQTISHDSVIDAVKDAFDVLPEQLAQSQDVAASMQKLRDSLLAIKQLQEEHSRPIEALTTQLRDLELIVKVANNSNFPATPDELRRYRKRSLELPPLTILKSILSTSKLDEKRKEERAKAEEERKKLAETLFDRYQCLTQTVNELTNLGGDDFHTSPQEPRPEFSPPEELGQIGVLKRQAAYLDQLSSLNLKQLETAINRNVGTDPLVIQDEAGANSAARLAGNILGTGLPLLAGSPAFAPIAPGEIRFRLKAASAEALSDNAKQVLSERKLAPAEQPLDRIVESLRSEIEATGQEVEALYGRQEEQTIRRVGGTLVRIATPIPFAGTNQVPPGLPPLPEEEQIPHTRGKVAPAGIAELLIIKQQLLGYEGAEVAHIENILRGERKLREHTRRQVTEELIFREAEVTSTEERELESTNRFEMTQETNATIREDAALRAGLTVSGSYGPTVDFSFSAEGSISRSKEEAIKTAAMFSQEITERSASKITERVLERISRRMTNEVVEKNEHKLDNARGLDHISGVYQWVSKLYEAQMFNYGLRMMFDFMVPEPAAFLMEHLKSAHACAIDIQKPPDFTLKPDEVSESVMSYGYYGKWGRLYEATDLTPPPEIYKTKSVDFKAEGIDATMGFTHSTTIALDEGYRAIEGSVACIVSFFQGSGVAIDFALGRSVLGFPDPGPRTMVVTLNNEIDSIPFAIRAGGVARIAGAVEVRCQRTERAMELWRLQTHAKLTLAYKARLAEYEEKLAAAEARTYNSMQGGNPAANLETMKDEIKKHCISILTDQHYDLFDAIDRSPSNGLPQINLPEAEAEGAYVRFFEQAFEWGNMTWLTYPYFWGRKSQWKERLAVDDPDPLFNQFLKAGFCRIVVPARPGFEGAIDHFMTYGELWNGGPLPPISSPLYLPVADEIAERLDQPGFEVPQGDPWLVRIPTTLVRLRKDDKLPKWVQEENGNWVEE